MAYQKLILMGMVIVGFVCLSNGADYYTPRPTPGPCSRVKCGYGAVCIVKDYKPICVCNTACIQIYKPVCGSDGKTYGNECMLRVASCEQQKHIKIAHQGKCAEVCHYNYRTYKVGESFIKNCNARCTCQAGGNVACVPLCPLVLIKCPAGSVVKYRQVPVGNGCFCRRPYCVPPVCRDNNRTYKVGDSFIKSDCSARCTCQAGGKIACVSLCPPVFIRCLPGHVVKYRKVPQGNGCFCKRPYCVPAPKPTTPRPKVCRYDDRTYKVGESFITKDCKGKCTCQAGGNVACVSLCPPVRIICPADQVIRYRQVPVGNGPCSCRRPYCAKRDIYTPY